MYDNIDLMGMFLSRRRLLLFYVLLSGEIHGTFSIKRVFFSHGHTFDVLVSHVPFPGQPSNQKNDKYLNKEH
jgi:hypothetical protein